MENELENDSSEQVEQPAVESIELELLFPCKKCEKLFKSKKELVGHESRNHKRGKNMTQQGDFECPDCHKRFKLARGLQGHKRIHRNMQEPTNSNDIMLDEVPASVEIEFSKDDTLNEVEQDSSQVENEMFELLEDDNEQVKQPMVDATENLGNFQCDKCEKRFNTNKQLVGHTAKSHKYGKNVIGEFSCCSCLNFFSNFRAFQAHQRIHPSLTSYNNCKRTDE